MSSISILAVSLGETRNIPVSMHTGEANIHTINTKVEHGLSATQIKNIDKLIRAVPRIFLKILIAFIFFVF